MVVVPCNTELLKMLRDIANSKDAELRLLQQGVYVERFRSFERAINRMKSTIIASECGQCCRNNPVTVIWYDDACVWLSDECINQGHAHVFRRKPGRRLENVDRETGFQLLTKVVARVLALGQAIVTHSALQVAPRYSCATA